MSKSNHKTKENIGVCKRLCLYFSRFGCPFFVDFNLEPLRSCLQSSGSHRIRQSSGSAVDSFIIRFFYHCAAYEIESLLVTIKIGDKRMV